MKKVISFVLNFAVLGVMAVSMAGMSAQAVDFWPDDKSKMTQAAQIDTSNDAMAMFGKGIKIFMGFLGVFCFILIIIAGVKWMSSNGDDKGIEGAKKTLYAAIGGLILIFIAYPLSDYIIKMVQKLGD